MMERRDFLKLSAAVPFFLFPKFSSSLQESEILSPSDFPICYEYVRRKNADPDFWTKPQGKNTRPFFTRQFDPNEYPEFSNQGGYSLEGYMNFSCGLATMTMVRKWAHYIHTGIVPDITIMGLERELKGRTYTAGRHHNVNSIIDYGYRPGLSDLAVMDTLRILDEKTNFYTVSEISRPFSTSSCGRGGGLCIDGFSLGDWGEWYDWLDRTREEITNFGGIAFLFYKKYGGGHFGLVSNINADDSVLYLDSRGYAQDGFPGIVTAGPITKQTTIIISMFGIKPNLPSVSHHSKNIPE